MKTLCRMYSVRITKNGSFHAYLSHRGRCQWSRRQALRHVAECKRLAHFQECEFTLEPGELKPGLKGNP